ncbi:MAG: beta-galactosidase [Candidatus Thorarchaeota archaeon]
MESNNTTERMNSVSMQPSLKIEGNAVRIEGQLVPLYSGSIDYWRIPHQNWKKVLDRIVILGFRIITTTVPWNIHEVASNLFDFGTTNEQRNLEGFLNLCQENKLYVIVRPGPCVNAELNYFGYPKRILYDPEIQALSAFGTRVIIPATPNPFPMPSYASEKFYDEVTKYFDAICPIFARHLAPGGSILGVQIDNELPLLFMNGAFSADYSKHAIRWYHEFLAGKYPSIGALNRAYRTRYNTFDQNEPPRALATTEREALPRYLDWMEFQEYYIGLAISVLASLLWSRGVRGVISYHNSRKIYPTHPLNISRTEREIDIQGVGLYLSKKQYDQIRRGALYLPTVSRLPYIAEGGLGTWPWGPPLTWSDQQFALIVAMMYGFRGFNAHMLVDRNRWIGSPISQGGEIQNEPATFLKRFLTILNETEFHTLTRNVPVLLLRNIEYERLHGLCVNSNWLTHLMGIPTELLLSNKTFSYTETIQKAYPATWDAFYWGLTQSKIPFAIGDSEMDRPALSHYQALFMPTFDFMSDTLQQKILEYVQHGGTAIIGPEIPYMGTDMRGCTILADSAELQTKSTRRPLVGLHDPFSMENNQVRVGSRTAGIVNSYGKGTIIYLGITLPPTLGREDAVEAHNVVTQTLKHLKLKPVGDRFNYSVDEIFYGVRGPSVIFQVNATNQPQSVTLQVAQRALIRDLWTGEQLPTRGPQEIALDPYDFRVFEVVR